MADKPKIIDQYTRRQRANRRMAISLVFIVTVAILGTLACFFFVSWVPFIISVILFLLALVVHGWGDYQDRKRTIHL